MEPTLIAVLGALGLTAIAVVVAIARRLRGHVADDEEIDTLPPDLAARLPVSLHPVIDPGRCIGSAACVPACPEGTILRLHDGHAHLVQPESCIGHGACARECPMEAITLVFGTATRGIDIPHVTPEFETNVPGLFIVGELGGMGLIRNAVAQGRQAVEHIARRGRSRAAAALDLLVVGAGPAGLAAALTAQKAGLTFEVIDQEESIGGTIAHYPRKKIVMVGAIELPNGRRIRQRELAKEELMAIWTEVTAEARLAVRLGERLEHVAPDGAGAFTVRTSKGEIRARQVVLAIGRRGTPRRLGVPGEELPKVAYSLREPDVFAGARVLVVGGGDSAIEAALQLADVPGTEVALSYRGDSFFRTKPKNRDRVLAALADGRVAEHLSTQVTAIHEDRVVLARSDRAIELPNDELLVFAGGVLPTKLLADAGVAMERKFGTR